MSITPDIAELARRLDEMKRAAAALDDSERLYRALFEGTSVAVTLRGAEFELIDCNAAALRLFGCSSVEECRGLLPPDLAPERQPDGRPSMDVFREMTADLGATGVMRGEWWVKRQSDGAALPTDVWATVIHLGEGRVVYQTLLDDISDRKEAERAERGRRAIEARYRLLVEQSRDAIFALDLETKLVFASPACIELFGYTPEEMLALERPFAALVLPASRPALDALQNALLERRFSSEQHTLAWRRKDGGTVYTESVVSPMLDERGAVVGFHTIARDVTDRHVAAEQTRRRATRDAALARITRTFLNDDPRAAIRTALEEIGEMLGGATTVLFVLAEDGATLTTAARWPEQARDEDGFGLDGREAPASVFARLDAHEELAPLSDAAPGARLDAWLAALPGAPPHAFYAPVGHGGRIFGLLSAHPADGGTFTSEEGAFLGQIAELIAVGEVRRQAQAALAKAKEDATVASLTKSAFLANMSHELRTPLNGVLGMVDLLGGTQLDDRQRRYVRVARASASLLLGAINDILDFSKIEAGRLDLEELEFTLADVVEEVAGVFAVSAEEKGLELCCRLAGPGEPVVGAPTRIRQVLVNLVANAIKFTKRGEVVIAATTDRVGSTSNVRVEVRDTGIGIPAAARHKLFHPFSQADASTTREYGGTGLGLAISRQIVERMGGEIGFSSEPGEGSCFWFSLRLRAAPFAERAEAQLDLRLAGVRVLAVDDNATNRELVSAHLEGAGMVCDTAADGEAAFALLLAAVERGAPYRIAILDRHMPGVDGDELARRVKADARTRATILVMLGSAVRALDAEERRRLGIAQYGTKPIWRPALLRMLSNVLADMPPAVESPAEARAEDDGDLPLILLVEDSPINAEVAGSILRDAGYAFDLVTDGLRAVEAVQRRPYDFVLMDCQLPELDGYDATRRIRALEAAGKLGGAGRLPIVALTASAMPGDLERCLAAGMDDHIAKPVDARTLLARIALRRGPRPRLTSELAAPPTRERRVVDLDAALARLRHNRALLHRIIRQFRDVSRGARDDLRRLVAARDAEGTAFVAHRLRGQAASFDAEALIARVEALEDATREPDWPLAAALLPPLERELDRLLEALTPAAVD